jgi:hypothetical protein
MLTHLCAGCIEIWSDNFIDEMCRGHDKHGIAMVHAFFILGVHRASSYCSSQSRIDRVSEVTLSELAPQRSNDLEKTKTKFLTRSIISKAVT